MPSPSSPDDLPPYPGLTIDDAHRVWNGRFPLDVLRFRHRRFDGATSKPRTWELWRRGPAGALLPYDPVQDQVVLIEQFRLPALAAGLDPVLVELPAGLCDPGEQPEATIRRETREEMRLDVRRLVRIGAFLLTPGGSNELCHLFAGEVAAPPASPDGIAGHTGLAEENEDIRTRVWQAEAAIEAAFAGRFANAVTAIALFWLAARRNWLRAAWSGTP